jgi:hypothetical protein
MTRAGAAVVLGAALALLQLAMCSATPPRQLARRQLPLAVPLASGPLANALAGPATWAKASELCASRGGLLDQRSLASPHAAGSVRSSPAGPPDGADEVTLLWAAAEPWGGSAAKAVPACTAANASAPGGCAAVAVNRSSGSICATLAPCHHGLRFLCRAFLVSEGGRSLDAVDKPRLDP